MKGACYRVEDNLEGSAGASAALAGGMIQAFDTKSLQYLDKTHGCLHLMGAVQSNTGYHIVVPLVQPYSALFGPEDRTFDQIRDDPHGWDALSESSQYLGEKVVGGHVCAEIETKDTYGITRTFFAKDYSLFPIRYERFNLDNTRLTADYDAIEVKSFDTPDGPVYVPIEGRETMYRPDHKPFLEYKCHVSRDSIIINGDIQDEQFVIPRGLARSVQDQAHLQGPSNTDLERKR
jgi:hypothetical protein